MVLVSVGIPNCGYFVYAAAGIWVYARRILRHDSGITDDECTISLSIRDGSIGTIVYTAEGNPSLPTEHFEAHADGKSVTMDDFLETHLFADGKHDVFKTAKREKGFREELASFVQAVEKGLPPVMAFEQIEAVTLTCLLAVRSLQSGSVYDL